jgi:hypothetical protein
MSTIVSAFVSNINERYSDSLKRYYEHGKILMKSTTPKVIFVDEIMFNLIGCDYDKTNTLIIKINKTDSYLYNYSSYLTKFHVNSTDHSKDTIEFMFTMCNKTEWVKRAIYLNHFKTEHFIWIDFGIKHIFQGLYTNEEFVEKIDKLKDKKYNKIRIGGIWNINYEYAIDIYKDVSWYFAGGVFGGNINSLKKFGNLMKTKCIDIMTSKNTIMWEVNIWYLIYKENRELFNIYDCNHDKSLIDNY